MLSTAMTPQQIRDAITASAELQALAAAGDTKGIADALSEGRTKIVSHFASERGVLERFPGGPAAADALLSKLETFAATPHPSASIVKRALKFLAQAEGLDLGSEATLGLLDALAAGGVITASERDGVRSMAMVADPVSVQQVESAYSLQPISTWTGEVTATELREGMVYATITYTSSVQGVPPRVETTFADDLTPSRVNSIIAARVLSLQNADAAFALFV